jgi:DNA-binding beta-propeller fold protein YncE
MNCDPNGKSRIMLIQHCNGRIARYFGLLGLAIAALLLVSHVRAQDFYIAAQGQIYTLDDSTGAVGTFTTFSDMLIGQGMAYGNGGDLYVAQDSDNTAEISSQIDSITPGGQVNTFANLTSLPTGLAFYGGNLYTGTTVSGTSEILKIDSSGNVTVFATLPSGTGPIGLAFDSSGNLYTIGLNAHMNEITLTGSVSQFTSLASYGQPVQLTYYGGDLYTVTSHNQVVEITLGGSASQYGTVPPGTGQESIEPQGIAFDGFGNACVTADDFFNTQTESGEYVVDELAMGGGSGIQIANSMDQSDLQDAPPGYLLAVEEVPEPSTWAMMVCGLGGFLVLRGFGARRLPP